MSDSHDTQPEQKEGDREREKYSEGVFNEILVTCVVPLVSSVLVPPPLTRQREIR